MKGKYHLLVSLGFFIGLWLLIPKIHVTEIIMAIFLTMYPDIDLKFDKILGHRSIWTHSILIPLIVFVFNPTTITILFIVTIGLHCLCDLRFTKQTGYYTIKILKVRTSLKTWYSKYRLDGKQSTAWLIGNFIISLGLLVWWCLI